MKLGKKNKRKKKKKNTKSILSYAELETGDYVVHETYGIGQYTGIDTLNCDALIEFEYANDYFRGNPLIDAVGAVLGITPQQLDCFFQTKDYTCLLPVEEPEEPVEEVVNEDN